MGKGLMKRKAVSTTTIKYYRLGTLWYSVVVPKGSQATLPPTAPAVYSGDWFCGWSTARDATIEYLGGAGVNFGQVDTVNIHAVYAYSQSVTSTVTEDYTFTSLSAFNSAGIKSSNSKSAKITLAIRNTLSSSAYFEIINGSYIIDNKTLTSGSTWNFGPQTYSTTTTSTSLHVMYLISGSTFYNADSFVTSCSILVTKYKHSSTTTQTLYRY